MGEHFEGNEVRRISLTEEQIREQQNRCVLALTNEALRIDDIALLPSRIDVLVENGQLIQRLRKRTHTYDNGSDFFKYIVRKDWISLPRADAKLSNKMAKKLCGLRLDPHRLWTGVATDGPVCTVDEVSVKRRQIMNQVRIFFAEQARNADPPQLIFSVVHNPVRDRITKRLRKDDAGRLLYHVHGHFLFYPPRRPTKRMRFEAAFEEEFGNGSGFEKVKNLHGIIGYLTAVTDRADMLDHNEFVKWHLQISRKPRFRLYGEFRAKAKVARKWKKKPSNGSQPKIAKTNRFVGKVWHDDKRYSIWDHLRDSPRDVYENQGIPREPDRTSY